MPAHDAKPAQTTGSGQSAGGRAAVRGAGRRGPPAAPLPALDAIPAETTVSGLSSGGYMAVQLHFAHSRTIKGAGAIAAGPYYCAQGSLWTALGACMQPGAWTPLPETGLLREKIAALEKAGKIDPTSNLAGSRAWLFSGARDETVYTEVVQALRRLYASFGAETLLVADKPAGHAMVTLRHGNACASTEPPFINDCDYDAAGTLLAHLLGPLAGAASPAGALLAFEQDGFAGGNAAAIGMAATGYAYVPPACATQRCRVHVAFHGCRQQAAEIGERFVREAGYNEWADANRLVILYPQALSRSGWSMAARNFVWNPRGCWDWWGYGGAQYPTKDGAQVRAVKAMLDRLSAPRQ